MAAKTHTPAKTFKPNSETIREEVAIAAPTSSERLLGSISMPIELRKPEPNGGPEPNGDEPPPPRPPAVSTPDLAFQFSPCLPDELRDPVVAAVREAVGATADVRAACVAGTERVAIWFHPLTPGADTTARDRGLQRLSLLHSGETFACIVNSSLIRSRAQDAWDAAPKRLDGDGHPDPDGPIHLTSFSLSFTSPNRVVTKIGGYDERPWPDVDFTLTTTDTIGASANEITCASSEDLDVDTSWLNFLTGIFLFVLPPLGLVFLVEDIIVGSVDAPNANAGAGCGAASLIPREILIPGGLKVVLLYRRAEVASGGLFAGGSYLVIPRDPAVTISGPTQIAVEEDDALVQRQYTTMAAEDLRPPLEYSWTADGSVISPHSRTTAVRFNTSGTDPGDILTKLVRLRVTDADDLVAQDDVTVRIHVTVDTDDLPPVCKVKPWLPVCER
jgi:hypothetical protein